MKVTIKQLKGIRGVTSVSDGRIIDGYKGKEQLIYGLIMIIEEAINHPVTINGEFHFSVDSYDCNGGYMDTFNYTMEDFKDSLRDIKLLGEDEELNKLYERLTFL